ncbi:MAG: type II toxin-antitoxin system death-on-curing family toxin [Deltaproteobacteria bacterium]|nr:type II toxin-antitoxin system death-on-curing family toxin [Deltaproteobacteria bacterium]
MQDFRWLSRNLVDAIHGDLLRQFGGAGGVRDSNLIESALARPRQRLAYDPTSDFASLAAAYGFGLTKNHGYNDGNKRIGFMAMYVFLSLNGLELEALEEEVVEIMLDVAAGDLSEEELAAWLRDKLEPRSKSSV